MFSLIFHREFEKKHGLPVALVMGISLLMTTAILFSGCQKAETPPVAKVPQKAAPAAPGKEAASPGGEEMNYEKALAKQYAEGTAVVITGKVTQIWDEKNLLMATRKDDVFGYLDNMVIVTFPEKPKFMEKDIVQVKGKFSAIKKYKTEGKGEYDAPFLQGESYEVIEKGAPTK